MASSGYSIVITPKGRKVARRGLRAAASQLGREINLTASVALLSLRAGNFGTVLGSLWLIIDPLLQALTYWILLTYILAVPGADISFSLFFTALTFWRSHAVMAVASCTLINDLGLKYASSSLPLRMAYLEFLFGELWIFMVRLVVLLGFLPIAGHMPTLSWIMIIPIAITQFTFTMAIVTWLSIVGNYVKDTAKLTVHVVWLWWFFSPGLYSIARIPDWFRPIYEANPFAHIFPSLHAALLEGRFQGLAGLAAVFAVSVLVLVLGTWRLSGLRHELFYRV